QRLYASTPGGPERRGAFAWCRVFAFFRTNTRADNAGHERGEYFRSRGNQRACDAAILLQPSSCDGASCDIALTCDVPVARDGGGRRLRGLRATYYSMVPSGGTTARSSPARRQARRPSRGAADKI